jgi:uncharacterized protein (TIGR01777 family)
MNILVSGASGLVGSACLTEMQAVGHNAHSLSRGAMWDPRTGRLNLEFDPEAIIHLAGEPIAEGKWTEAKKKRIKESRVDATRSLCETLARLTPPPRIMLSASAVGFYGPRGDKVLIETSPGSSDFLGEVCQQWEKATQPLAAVGTRVVHLRFGIILSPKGGALAKMLPIFKIGLGGKLSDGSHWMSWIALEDVIRAILFLLERNDASGAFNIVSPNPVTNADFTATLAAALGRPAFMPVPAALLRFLYGEFADAGLLASQRAIPERLQQLGFSFKLPELDDSLYSIL